MGYLATEIIVLLAGAAVLGLVIGWALFGLGRGKAAAPAVAPRLDGDLKAERDQRKRVEGRILELEARETNFTERLQDRDTKIAELMHQLDDQAKYRVETASEVNSREVRIAELEAQLEARGSAPSVDVAPVVSAPDPELATKLAEHEAEVARLLAQLAEAKAVKPDTARIQQLERENAELRTTLVVTAGAAPTTTEEKDQIIARLNEEVTGLRAAYEAAEQALEEQDAAIDKLTRDLQSTHQKINQAATTSAASEPSQSRPAPHRGGAAAPKVAQPAASPPPALPAAKPPAPPAALDASESTVAISLDALVSQIDGAPFVSAAPPVPAAPQALDANESTVAISLDALVSQIDASPVPPPLAAPPAPAAPDLNESTVALSLDDLVAQIDKKPAPVPPVIAPPPAPAAPDLNESTVALSLDDLVAQIDKKPAPPAPAPVAAPAPPAPEAPDLNESTVALSLDDLVAAIDSGASKPAPTPQPAPAPAPAPPDLNESTVAISLDALVAQIEASPSKPMPVPAAAPTPFKAPPPMELDSGESTVAISLADLVAAVEDEPDFTNLKLDVAPAPDGAHDDLQRIRGVGPATAKRLNSAGIRTWVQMSQLSDNDLDQVADLLKISLDKIKREQWVEQARALIGG